MKLLYLVVLLPAFSVACFLVEVFRSHGYESVGRPQWLAITLAIASAVLACWLPYSRFLMHFAQVSLRRALLLDLLSYLPFLLLLAYAVPAVRSVVNAGTLVFSLALTLSLALKAGVLLYYRRSWLEAVWSRPYLVVGSILALALLLRGNLISAGRFHGDEALYSYWGLLIATGKDIFLKAEVVDKPPVLFYTLALSFKLFGPTETAARLPNLIASLAGIAITYGMARELYDRRVATLAALFLALSPFDIQFAPTAFTDPLMVALALGASLAALKGYFLGAGLLAGLAVMTKPTAIFFAPLLLVLGGWHLVRIGWRPHLPAATLRLAPGFALIVLLGLAWDVLIRVGSPRVFDAGAAHYGGLDLVAWADALPRLRAWLGELQYLTGSRPLNAALAVGIPLLLAYGLWRRPAAPNWLFDWILVSFGVYFVAVHTLLSFKVWDRYLLGLAPIGALLLARVVLLPYHVLRQAGASDGGLAAYGLLAGLLLVVALSPPTGTALRHGFPLGGDHGAFEGIDEVAHYFKATVPPGSIVFHRWLGWHYSFYMFGYPYDFYYYPTDEYLLDVARRLPDVEKYVVFPSWVSSHALEVCLANGGWELEELHRTYRADGTVSFTVYRIEPQPGARP